MYLELDTKPPWGHIFSTIGVWKNDGEKCQSHDLVMSAQTSETQVSQKRFPTGQCFAVHLRHSSDELAVGFGTASKFSMAGWWFFALWKMMELKSIGVILPYDIPNMMGKISQMFQSPPARWYSMVIFSTIPRRHSDSTHASSWRSFPPWWPLTCGMPQPVHRMEFAVFPSKNLKLYQHCGTIFALWHENGKGTSLNIWEVRQVLEYLWQIAAVHARLGSRIVSWSILELSLHLLSMPNFLRVCLFLQWTFWSTPSTKKSVNWLHFLLKMV